MIRIFEIVNLAEKFFLIRRYGIIIDKNPISC